MTEIIGTNVNGAQICHNNKVFILLKIKLFYSVVVL